MVAVLRKVYGGFMVPAKVAILERLAMVEGESAYNSWTQH